MTIAVAVAGAGGRMGRMLVSGVVAADDLSLGAAFGRPGSAIIGTDAGELAGVGNAGVTISADPAACLDDFAVMIDFSVPAATLENVAVCEANGKGMVIGTTGFDPPGLQAITAAAETIPIVLAPNMSVGVNVTFKLIDAAARALGDDVDVEVFEAHHRHKIDAPSGTAVRMGKILADTLGRDLATDAVYGREGITGRRSERTIGFHSLRGGDIVGEHTVTFAGTGERIEITHRAGSRENFAVGALKATRYTVEQDSGLYDMGHVLDL